MNGTIRNIIIGAALIGRAGYALAESQGNGTSTDSFSNSLAAGTSILLAGASVALVANLIGCCTQVISAYNHYKAARRVESQEPGAIEANRRLLDMKTEYATNM